MSTNNIGFLEEISKIIPKLSSNIIKYAPIISSSGSADQKGWISMLIWAFVVCLGFEQIFS